MISASTLREIDDLLRYLDNAEKELNCLEPISASQDVLTAQLREHKVFHEELEQRQKQLSAIISRCKVMLREVCSEECDDVRNKLTNMCDQAEVICRLSSSRLQILEEKLPLATYFSMTFDRLLTWLADIELEITCIEVKEDDLLEEVKAKQDRAKAAQRLIDDYKAVMDDVMTTGQDLMSISTRYDAAGVQRSVDHVSNRYLMVKQAVRSKLALLDEALRRLSADVSMTLESIVDDLQYLNGKSKYADPIAANPVTLRGQIAENESIVEDLRTCKSVIHNVKGAINKKLSDSSDEPSSEELAIELETLGQLQDSVFNSTRQRSVRLRGAVGVADRFQNNFEATFDLLSDLRDDIMGQDMPAAETEVVLMQQKELKALHSDFKKALSMLDSCRRTVDELATYCDASGLAEVEKHLEDMESLKEEIDDRIKDRNAHLDVALERSKFFNRYYNKIMEWLPATEDKIIAVSPVAAHPRSVKIQIEELKVLKIQLRPCHVDIDNLNQYHTELHNTSPFMAEALTGRVMEVNERWSRLLKNFQEREKHLEDILVELGEVNHSVDDVIGFLQQVESDLHQFEKSQVDSGHVILYLRKIQKELVNLDGVIARLNGVIQVSAERSGKTSGALLSKQDEMMCTYLDVQVLARDKLNELHSRLKQVKGYMASVDDLLHWLNDFRHQLKSTEFLGVLPEEVKHQHDLIMRSYEDLMTKEVEIQAIMLNGEDMLARCREKDAKQLKSKLDMLQEKIRETKLRVEKRKKKMEGHVKAVEMFHKLFSTHIDWLDKAEKTLAKLKNRSKTLEKIREQMKMHEDLKKDVDFQSKIAQNVENTGTYLKYFGSKRDTVYVKNLLVGVKVRWKKLVRKVDEAGRLLQQAYREDKRFYDCWKSLVDWLDEGEITLKKYVTDVKSKDIKGGDDKDADNNKESKEGDELHKFQLQMSNKHPNYYSTMRLGTSLRDQCSHDDQEHAAISGMLEELKKKWNHMRSMVSQKQVRLEEGLMTSGRVADAMESLHTWLSRAEAYLLQDNHILGDLDTVSILIEKHKLFQQEVQSRKEMASSMISNHSAVEEQQQQATELKDLWERVKRLSEARDVQLREALKLAERFNDAVEVMKDWLPTAEAELKLHTVAYDEDALMQMIENHDKFHEELISQRIHIEKIKTLAAEILANCHANAVRFVKYYLTITQTRWEQAVSRSTQRSHKFHEALNTVRENTSILQQLSLSLSEDHALLQAKQKDGIPQDLTLLQQLNKQQVEFHDELCSKQEDIDKVVKYFIGGVSSGANSPAAGQSEKRTNSGRKNRVMKSRQLEGESMSAKATSLQNKWILVSKMSIERKKKLQDALSKMLELENSSNFDFEVWRQSYISWNRNNKLKFMDFFRRQDRHGTGLLTKKEFIDGIMASKFPTNETELMLAFNQFDTRRLGRIKYKTFVDAIMRPDRQLHSRESRLGTVSSRYMLPAAAKQLAAEQQEEARKIESAIEHNVSRCRCRFPFKYLRVADDKYKFGDKEKVHTVKLMNGGVFVRFGSSWMGIKEFVCNNDPCKVKNRSTSRSANKTTTKSATNLTSCSNSSLLSTPRNNKNTSLNNYNNYSLEVSNEYDSSLNESNDHSYSNNNNSYTNNNNNNNYATSNSLSDLNFKRLNLSNWSYKNNNNNNNSGYNKNKLNNTNGNIKNKMRNNSLNNDDDDDVDYEHVVLGRHDDDDVLSKSYDFNNNNKRNNNNNHNRTINIGNNMNNKFNTSYVDNNRNNNNKYINNKNNNKNNNIKNKNININNNNNNDRFNRSLNNDKISSLQKFKNQSSFLTSTPQTSHHHNDNNDNDSVTSLEKSRNLLFARSPKPPKNYDRLFNNINKNNENNNGGGFDNIETDNGTEIESNMTNDRSDYDDVTNNDDDVTNNDDDVTNDDDNDDDGFLNRHYNTSKGVALYKQNIRSMFVNDHNNNNNNNTNNKNFNNKNSHNNNNNNNHNDHNKNHNHKSSINSNSDIMVSDNASYNISNDNDGTDDGKDVVVSNDDDYDKAHSFHDDDYDKAHSFHDDDHDKTHSLNDDDYDKGVVYSNGDDNDDDTSYSKFIKDEDVHYDNLENNKKNKNNMNNNNNTDDGDDEADDINEQIEEYDDDDRFENDDDDEGKKLAERFRAKITGMGLNSLQSPAPRASSSSSSTSTWPRGEHLQSPSVQQPPMPSSARGSRSKQNSSRRVHHSNPPSTANSPSSRYALRTFTSSRSPQRSRSRVDAANLGSHGNLVIRRSNDTRQQAAKSSNDSKLLTSSDQAAMFFTTDTLNI